MSIVAVGFAAPPLAHPFVLLAGRLESPCFLGKRTRWRPAGAWIQKSTQACALLGPREQPEPEAAKVSQRPTKTAIEALVRGWPELLWAPRGGSVLGEGAGPGPAGY